MIHFSPEDTKSIISSLKNGQVVAVPTETVYGLAISLNSPTALEKLIYLKKREIGSGKVFTLVPESKFSIDTYATIPASARSYIKKYIPGEITLILPKNPTFSHPYFDHFDSIGLRIPDHPLFRNILPEVGPLLLTSANPRGEQPATTSESLEKSMPKIDAIVDGRAGGHAPSTIVSFLEKKPEIVRQGDLNIEQ